MSDTNRHRASRFEISFRIVASIVPVLMGTYDAYLNMPFVSPATAVSIWAAFVLVLAPSVLRRYERSSLAMLNLLGSWLLAIASVGDGLTGGVNEAGMQGRHEFELLSRASIVWGLLATLGFACLLASLIADMTGRQRSAWTWEYTPWKLRLGRFDIAMNRWTTRVVAAARRGRFSIDPSGARSRHLKPTR